MLARVEDGVGWMTFNNPDRRNALKMEMNQATVQILEAFEANDDVRVVVMHGAGDKAFVSGADISEFEEHRSTPEARENYDAIFAAATRSFTKLSKPLIAMIRGFCIGGGMATSLHADLRIAADDAVFAVPAARLGVGYGFAGIDKLTHIVGPTKAAEVMLTARKFDATEAYEMGLLNRVVAVDELETTVNDLAALIVNNAPLTVRTATASVRATFQDPEKRDLAAIADMVEVCFRSRDYQEGRTAFMEKRTPQFEGR